MQRAEGVLQQLRITRLGCGHSAGDGAVQLFGQVGHLLGSGDSMSCGVKQPTSLR
jgi:hypothetical protein